MPLSSPSWLRPMGNIASPTFEANIELLPLHLFVDLGLALGPIGSNGKSELLTFIDEVTSLEVLSVLESPMKYHRDHDDHYKIGEDEDDMYMPSRISRVQHAGPVTAREQERERRRLERLVLEDLDLGFDYRQNFTEKTKDKRAHPERKVKTKI